MRKPRSSMNSRLKKINPELEEIELLKSWIEFGRPDPGTNPLSLPPLPSNARTGRLDQNTFSPYAGCKKFHQLPLSKKIKDGLSGSKFNKMTEIQRASLPHSLAGRDILGAAKTGSGKTLAFIIPVLEKLYRLSWVPQDGVGSIIISPTRELACQIFEVLKSVGKHHGFSAGLLIGGHEDVDTEKELVNNMNILVCTPGRLLQHMDETPNFSCDQLQVLVLDEADRILDVGFKKALNAIISQLPKQRQTLLFSATQTKSVSNLARLSLQDPEYISVHEEAQTATPSRLYQTAMVVPLDQKLDMLWSFVKTHLNSRIVVFLSTCKQVKFVFEAFKKLRPGIPLKCLHGRMKQPRRQGIYAQFCEKRSVLFCTDVASRGLDFNKAVDWVVQVDCPENVDAYIHRVGRTARYLSAGRSVLFLMPTEMKILEKLEEKKIPVQFTKVNTKRLQSISGLLAALLVKYKDLQYLAQRAFITYVKAIHKQPDKEIFDVMKLPIDEFSASLGLPMTPKIRFLPQKNKGNGVQEVKGYEPAILIEDNPIGEDLPELPTGSLEKCEDDDEVDNDFLIRKQDTHGEVEKETRTGDILPVTRVSKKKKLKINVHRPAGSRVVFDEEGNTLPPLATIADMRGSGSPVIDKDKVDKRYKEMYEKMKEQDKEDKLLQTQRLKEKRMKDKIKLNRGREEGDDDLSGSDGEETSLGQKAGKRSKIYFDSDNDDGEIKRQKDKMGIVADSISLAQQEELALKLLSSMNK